MKKSVVALSMFGSLLMCNSVFASSTNTECTDSDVVFENLGIPVEVVTNMLEVKKLDGLNGLCAYVFASPTGNQVIVGNDRYAVLGKLIDTEQKIVVQDDLLKKYQNIGVEGFEALKQKASLVFGESTREIVYITDPECPYCKKLSTTLSSMKDLKVYVVLMPLPSHERGVKVSEQIVCNNEELTSFDEYNKYVEEQLKTTSDEKGCLIFNERKKELSRISRKHRLDGGVPKVVFSDGSYEVGAMPAEFIELKLKEIAKSVAQDKAATEDEEDNSDRDDIEHLQDVTKVPVERGTVVEDEPIIKEMQIDEKDQENNSSSFKNLTEQAEEYVKNYKDVDRPTVQEAEFILKQRRSVEDAQQEVNNYTDVDRPNVQEVAAMKELQRELHQALKQKIAEIKASSEKTTTDKTKLRSDLIDFTQSLKASLSQFNTKDSPLVHLVDNIERAIDEDSDEDFQKNIKEYIDNLDSEISESLE